MRDRGLLHLSKVEEFAAWCGTRGLVRVPTKGEYEVLRMERPSGPPLIVHARQGAREHATLWGVALEMFEEWRKA